MNSANNPDWREFQDILNEEIEKRAEVKITIKKSIALALIVCNIFALGFFIFTTIKIYKKTQLIERKIQVMDSVNHKKELCIYCRQ